MKAISERSRHIRNWMMFLEYPLLLTPTTVKPIPEVNVDLGGAARVKELFWNDLRFISSMNVLGLPAAVVPVGLHNGLPVGVQIVGSRYREDPCLDAAEAVENKAAFWSSNYGNGADTVHCAERKTLAPDLEPSRILVRLVFACGRSRLRSILGGSCGGGRYGEQQGQGLEDQYRLSAHCGKASPPMPANSVGRIVALRQRLFVTRFPDLCPVWRPGPRST